jgi:ABC-type transport system involved in cytochrome bd biosynthesis fused ATPase/permease subunit
MASVLARAALLTVLTIAAAAALMGLSGMIIFADISAPRPTTIAAEALPTPPALSGVSR